MDKTKAIQTFLEQVEKLDRLPLITDAEIDALWGEELTATLQKLASLNEKEQYCQNCQERCCPAVRCELYAPQFKRCPIYEFRPPICRLHYCHQFFKDDNDLLKEMSDIFFDSLLTADRLGSSKVRFFDTPPLKNCCPDLIAEASQYITAVREGNIDPEEASKLIRELAGKYRTPVLQTSV
jgi:hypothetical protein